MREENAPQTRERFAPHAKLSGMCGRYSLRRLDYTREEFEALRMPGFEEFDEKRIVPRFDIRPTQSVPAVRLDANGKQTVSMLQWGLVPSWAKPDVKAKPFNARADKVQTSGMYRQAFERRRCLIPADGFFEWTKTMPKHKYFIHRTDEKIFAFAGVWERWKASENSAPLDSCTIITTEPTDLLKPFHNRSPVILHESEYDKWLDREIPGKGVFDLLRPYDGELELYKVANGLKTVGPEVVKRVA